MQDKDLKQTIRVDARQPGVLASGRALALHELYSGGNAGRCDRQFTVTPHVTVTGKFTLKEVVFDGKQVAIYRIDGSAAK